MKIWTKRILLFLICMGVAGCLAVVWLSAYVKSETAARILSAEEAAKQMRLRNLSGIIIIDFIDMADTAAQKEVTQRLKKAVAKDRIKTVVVGMTELGLMQVTRKPIVFVDCYFDQGERYNNVGLDDEGGMRQMTEHLLKLGHRNMLFVGDQPVLWGVDARRLRGHQQAMEAAGLAWQETHYFCVSKDRKRRGEDYQRMLEYVRMLGCTVCLFISDYYAVEAIDFLLDQGVRVPEDISITGFDDNILSRVIRPRLTTVHQNVTRKAQTALHALFDILDKTAKEPVSLVLPTRIIRGSSVKDMRLNRTIHTNLTE